MKYVAMSSTTFDNTWTEVFSIDVSGLGLNRPIWIIGFQFYVSTNNAEAKLVLDGSELLSLELSSLSNIVGGASTNPGLSPFPPTGPVWIQEFNKLRWAVTLPKHQRIASSFSLQLKAATGTKTFEGGLCVYD